MSLSVMAGQAIGGQAEIDPLAATAYIDHGHPRITALVGRLEAGAATPRDKARAAFAFVRDEIAFGFAPEFYDMRASEVLAAGIGFCNTKSTLFVALLRAMRIPARQVFVDIDAGILAGLIDPGTPFVDHSYVELELDGRWVALDAYIVDRKLHAAAMARLASEGRTLGYGVHSGGVADWNGKENAFSQFVASGGDAVRTTRPARVFRDVGDFYERGECWNRLSLPARILAPFAFAAGNRRIAALRG